jgi:hypothetical protein
MKNNNTAAVRYVILRTGTLAECLAVPAFWSGTAIDLLRTVARSGYHTDAIKFVARCVVGDGWYVSRDQQTGAVIAPSAAVKANIDAAEDLDSPVGLLRYDVLDANGRPIAHFWYDDADGASARVANPTHYDKAPLRVRPVVCGAA